jgi:hypothetical protein
VCAAKRRVTFQPRHIGAFFRPQNLKRLRLWAQPLLLIDHRAKKVPLSSNVYISATALKYLAAKIPSSTNEPQALGCFKHLKSIRGIFDDP